MSHANALLTPKGRLRLARCVVEDGWTLRRAAERFQVSVTTAARWAARYRDHGEDGMQDRSSRPVNSPQRTPVRRERRIIAIRVNRRWGPARIGFLLGIHPSTAPGPVEVRAGPAVLARPCHRQSDPPLRAPQPGSWSTSTSRNSAASGRRRTPKHRQGRRKPKQDRQHGESSTGLRREALCVRKRAWTSSSWPMRNSWTSWSRSARPRPCWKRKGSGRSAPRSVSPHGHTKAGFVTRRLSPH
jgi:hypothetical protein